MNGIARARRPKIEVHEPSIDDTVKILEGSSRITSSTTKSPMPRSRAAAELSEYINDRFLPDKAIDVIDEVGAWFKIRPATAEPKIVNDTDIEEVAVKIAYPPRSVSTSDKERHGVGRASQKVVFAKTAIQTVGTAIACACWFGSPQSRWVIFVYRTSVGKPKWLNNLPVGLQFLRFDMSEHMEAHGLASYRRSRVCGFRSRRLSLKRSRAITPVLLLDDRKAHPDLFNILLQSWITPPSQTTTVRRRTSVM